MKHKLFALVIAASLAGTAIAQTTSTDNAGQNNTANGQQDTGHHDYGWIGLLGLAGLAGLLKRDNNRAINTSTTR